MKTTKLTLLTTVLFGSLALFSCENEKYIYSPASLYAPVFDQAGQAKVTARITDGPSSGSEGLPHHNFGGELQGGYSLTKHLSVVATAGIRSEADNFFSELVTNINGSISSYKDSNVVKYKRQLAQLGLGYTFPLSQNNSALSLYGYFGLGKNSITEVGQNNGNAYNFYHHSNSSLFSFQPAYTFGLKKQLNSSIIFRYTLVNNNNIRTNYDNTTLKNAGLSNIQTLQYFALGYQLTYKLEKYPWLSLEAQYLFSSTGETSDQVHYARGSLGSLGVVLNVNELSKRK